MARRGARNRHKSDGQRDMVNSWMNQTSRVVKGKRVDWHKVVFLLIAVGPAYLGYVLFTLYPNAMSVWYSLLDWDGLSEPKFVGLHNYITMFTNDPFVWRAFKNDLILMVFKVVLTVVIALMLAYFLSYKKYSANRLYKVLYFLPNILPLAVTALIWSFIYDGDWGLLNSLLRWAGIDIGTFYWLGRESTALGALIPPSIWGGVGLYVLIYMNAMSSIPESMYEAAIIEGAGDLTRLFRITIPLIWGVVRVGIIFIALNSLRGFELVLILTNGGPRGATNVVGLHMYNMLFGPNQQHAYGYASAIGMLLFVILVGAKLLIDTLFPNRRVEY